MTLRRAARGFAAHSLELADLIVKAIRWPGFAFVEVLSPCMAFRSEEFGWKNQVHAMSRTIENDRAGAYAAALADDGFSLGVLFKDDRVVRPAEPLAMGKACQPGAAIRRRR